MSHTLGILGYGRFGEAFGGLAAQAGIELRAFDPITPVPADIAVDSPTALVEQTDLIMLAVPVPALRGALEDMRPALTASHVVFDVASVKLAAEATMAEALADEIPWVATHPLFGPTALATGQRPLRVVVCPNPLHESATRAIRDLFTRVGCEIVDQDADTHDRDLARGHALTFFVAKGMLEVGGEGLSADGPPSVQAMAKVVQSVRSDAGHLFLAIERDNPYAAQARRDLLDSLTAAHEGIEAASPDTIEGREATGIPDLGARAPELKKLRSRIDDVDRELVRLLGRRLRLARGAGEIKAERGHSVRDPGRELAVLAERREWAEEEGIDPRAIDEVFRAVMRLAREAQEAG